MSQTGTHMKQEKSDASLSRVDITSYESFFSFKDPDGNTWLMQEVTTRFTGRI